MLFADMSSSTILRLRPLTQQRLPFVQKKEIEEAFDILDTDGSGMSVCNCGA
jgi:hypothetical protein